MWCKLFVLFAMPMAVLAADDSVSITLSDTPAAVQSTINARLGGAKREQGRGERSEGEERFRVRDHKVNGD